MMNHLHSFVDRVKDDEIDEWMNENEFRLLGKKSNYQPIIDIIVINLFMSMLLIRFCFLARLFLFIIHKIQSCSISQETIDR